MERMQIIRKVKVLLLCCLVIINVKSVDSCGDYLRASMKETNPCPQISSFANCLKSRYKALGRPFGMEIDKNIFDAVRKSVKQICMTDCPIRVVNNVSAIPESLTTGNELKVCVFDSIIASKANKRNVCDIIREMVECVLLKATEDEYMLTPEALDVGTFITIELLKSTFRIKCPKQALRMKLLDKYIGGKQAS